MKLNLEQIEKLQDITIRARNSEREGTYATVDGVDTVDDIWYLLDIITKFSRASLNEQTQEA